MSIDENKKINCGFCNFIKQGELPENMTNQVSGAYMQYESVYKA